MTLPDVGPLGSLAGWFVAVSVVLGILSLAVLGKVVFGPTSDRDALTIKELTRALNELGPLVREQRGLIDRMLIQQEFLVGFVRDVIRERMNDDRPGS